MLYLIFLGLPVSPVCTWFLKEFGPFSGNQVTYHSLSIDTVKANLGTPILLTLVFTTISKPNFNKQMILLMLINN